MVSSPDKIPWHSGLLLILLASTGSASGSLSRLGEEEHPFPNGAIVPYEASLSLVCPPEPTWLIDGSPPEKSLDSSLSLSSPPLETRLRIECLSKLSEDRTSYSFVYIQSNISYTQPKRRLQTDFEAEIRMEFGEDVSLSCAKSSPEEEGTLHWLRNGIEELSASWNILRLSNVTQSSAMGCLLRDAKDGSPLAYQETQIRVPPKIQYPSGGSHYQLPGSSFHEICEANTQQIQWLKAPGGPMEEEERLSPSGQLNLASLSQDTHLICRAQNEDGKDDVEIHVLIVKPSEALELHKRLYAYEVSDIKCEASIDPRVFSEVTYAWFVNGTLDTDQTENVYKVPEVDSGNYTCVISTPVDKVFVETLVLPAVALNIDSEFPHTLQVLRKEPYPWVNCSASGEPQPSIQWLWVKSEDASEELPLHSDKGLLKLNASLALDSSVFKCRAENPQGLVERNLTLKVFDPVRLSETRESSLSVNASQQVTLTCGSHVDPRLESHVSWLKDGEPLEHFLTPDREGVFIPYLHMDHGGTYSCIRKTPLETFVSNQSLSVLVEAPSIELSGNVRKVTVGSSLDLECLTQGIPAPSIQWKKGDHKVSDNEHLHIQHIAQSGSYSCYAVNEYGSKTESLSIEVYNKTRVSLDKETLISETSDHVILDCPVTIDSRLNITSIAWYKEKNMAEPISFEKELVFRNATQKDQGTYICRVSTPVDAVNQTLRLTVLSEGPSFLSTEEDVRTLEGSNVTVACQANGLPIPKVSWSRKGLPLTSEDGHISISPLGDLSIYFVSLNDQGNYTCSASNIYGSISTHSTIEVIQRSKMATDFKKVKNVIRNVRENVVLECDVVYDSRLDEEVELLWKKDDVPIRINRSKYIAAEKSLKIYNLDISDEGTYECLIKTPFESISSKTALIVSGEPPKIVSEFKKVMLYEGEDLRLECLVRGVPRPSLVWHFQDAPLTNAYVHEIATASKVFRESRVIVKNITKEHDGVYQCRADNDYGTGVAKFSRVNVLSRTKATISESGEISVHAGSNLKIPCAITTDQLNQITNIQWVKPFKVGAKDRVDFGIDGSLSIQDVQKRHSGEYRCLVTTILDNANVTVNVTVNVNAPFISSFPEEEIFIFQGESLALFCRANGIPKPTISWNFNQTSTKAQEEFKILNAISSDSGVYECLARNQYGETRRKSLLRVVQLPFLEEEISVDEGATAELHCIPPRPHVNIHWVGPKSALNGSQLMHDPDTGVFSLESVDLNSVGEYSCVISLENGRSRTLNRHLRIKPEIIMSRNNTHVEVLEGKNLTLECNVLPGIGAKRLWKHNENIIIPGGNREVSNRGGLLTIDNIRRDVDSGKYICIAIADFGKDTIEYTVDVKSLPITLPEEVSCSESHSINAILISKILRIGNDSALVRWEYPPRHFNASCYERISLGWWTSEKDGSFLEIPTSFSERETVLEGLKEGLRYFVQVHLKKNSEDGVGGETRSFILEDLMWGDSTSDPREMSHPEGGPTGFSLPLLLIAAFIFCFLLLAIGVGYYVLYHKKKKSRKRLFPCCGTSLGEKKLRKRGGGAIYNHPDYRDFQLIQSPPRGIDDFMQNLAPQWPEPEPPAKLGLEEPSHPEETTALFKPQANGVVSPHTAGPVHPSQNNSISSSWSSLFNMPIDPANVRMSGHHKSKFPGFVT